MTPGDGDRHVRRGWVRVTALAGIAVLAAAAGFAAGWYWTHTRVAAGAPADGVESGEGAGESERLYTCGMHPWVVQKGPGECPICQMKLTPVKPETAGRAPATQPAARKRRILYWRAPMDPNYVSDRPGKSPMGMDLVPVYADEEEAAAGPTVTVSPVIVQNMGIRTTRVRRGPLVRTIRTIGRVDYNERTLTFVDTKFEGWIEKLHVAETGMVVRRGDPLFDVYSPQLYATQEEYLAAVRNLAVLSESSLPSAREEARRLLEAAEVKLRYFDITEEQIAALREQGRPSKTMTLYAPASGIVTEKMALQGMYVRPGMRLYTIADLSRVWTYVDIYEYELPWVRVGQRARMTLPYIPGVEFIGEVVYIYPYLEQKARVVRVRLEFDNPDWQLKPDMYADVTLESTLDRHALLIPREAYIDSGQRQIVFVVRGRGRFEPREIQVGVETEEGLVEVLAGLAEGEEIVVSGQFLLDAESRLREAIAKMQSAHTEPGAEPPAPAATQPAATQPAVSTPPDARYACPMPEHPDAEDPAQRGPYFSDQPGRCPVCGMKLKPLEELPWAQPTTTSPVEPAVAYTCPEHQNIVADSPGECPYCGRPLEPFRMLFTCRDPAHADVIDVRSGTCPRDGLPLVPFRGIWVDEDMAAANVPPDPAPAEVAPFRCPDHPLVHSDRPGRCTICARPLEPAQAVATTQPATQPAPGPYVCPMHPDQSRPAPGVCEVCGMRLVPRDRLPRPATASAAVRVAVDHLMEHYLALQERLAADRTDDIARHALGLVAACDDLRRHLDDPEVHLPESVGQAVNMLREAALRTTGESLEPTRTRFVEISDAMRVIIDHVRPDRERWPTLYIFHCPMSKADWIQPDAEKRNPYYGFQMLRCGEPVATR